MPLAKAVANTLVDAAYAQGSGDNLAALVIPMSSNRLSERWCDLEGIQMGTEVDEDGVCSVEAHMAGSGQRRPVEIEGSRPSPKIGEFAASRPDHA